MKILEYIFGTTRTKEILKTKNKTEHTNLTGFQHIEITYPDCVISDSFKIVNKYDSKEDAEGNCYDWYEISNHSRIIDKSNAIKEDYQSKIEYLAMMTDVEFPEDEEEDLLNE